MRAVIFVNGVLEDREGTRSIIDDADLFIAVDGGARHAAALGILPHAIVGDMDSIDPEHLAELDRQGVVLHRHPTHKDATDLELALHLAMDRGASDVLLVGAMGGRWDQALGNILLLTAQPFSTMALRIVDGRRWMALLRGGSRLPLPDPPGSTVSLLPIAGDAHGVSTQGLTYPLDGDALYLGRSRGISNMIDAHPAGISLERGMLLVVVEA